MSAKKQKLKKSQKSEYPIPPSFVVFDEYTDYSALEIPDPVEVALFGFAVNTTLLIETHYFNVSKTSSVCHLYVF